MLRILIMIGFAVLGLTDTAYAGRRTLLFTNDAEPLPEGMVEAEQWLWARTWQPQTLGRASGASTGWLWMGMVYGLSEHVELAIPWEAATTRTGTRITNMTAEARLRLFDRLDESAWSRPLVRVFFQQNFDHPDNGGRWLVPWGGANLILGIGPLAGTRAALDAGITTDFHFDQPLLLTHTLGVGCSVPATDLVRIGVEYYHEIALGEVNEGRRYFMAGPSIAFARHRLWATAGALLGLTDQTPAFTPRLLVGAAF